MTDGVTANAWLYALCILTGSMGITAGIILLGDYLANRWWEKLTT